MLRIVVLDHDVERIRACARAVHQAVKQLGIDAEVTINCEPPYLSRLDVWGRLPALEIEGLIWNRKSTEAFTCDEVVGLLKHHYQDKHSNEGTSYRQI